MSRRAVVIGAGIGGLTAAAGLHRAGWDVTVCERAPRVDPVGAGLAVAPNALRALDTIGAGDPIRAQAVSQDLGIREPGGAWLIRVPSGAAGTIRSLRCWRERGRARCYGTMSGNFAARCPPFTAAGCAWPGMPRTR